MHATVPCPVCRQRLTFVSRPLGLACPFCREAIRFPGGQVPVGARVRCARCKGVFTAEQPPPSVRVFASVERPCPHCGVSLTMRSDLQPGRELKCPKCAGIFPHDPCASTHAPPHEPAARRHEAPGGDPPLAAPGTGDDVDLGGYGEGRPDAPATDDDVDFSLDAPTAKPLAPARPDTPKVCPDGSAPQPAPKHPAFAETPLRLVSPTADRSEGNAPGDAHD